MQEVLVRLTDRQVNMIRELVMEDEKSGDDFRETTNPYYAIQSKEYHMYEYTPGWETTLRQNEVGRLLFGNGEGKMGIPLDELVTTYVKDVRSNGTAYRYDKLTKSMPKIVPYENYRGTTVKSHDGTQTQVNDEWDYLRLYGLTSDDVEVHVHVEVYVTSVICFTEKAAERYIEDKGYTLSEPRVKKVISGYENQGYFAEMRKLLLSIGKDL